MSERVCNCSFFRELERDDIKKMLLTIEIFTGLLLGIIIVALIACSAIKFREHRRNKNIMMTR